MVWRGMCVGRRWVGVCVWAHIADVSTCERVDGPGEAGEESIDEAGHGPGSGKCLHGEGACTVG